MVPSGNSKADSTNNKPDRRPRERRKPTGILGTNETAKTEQTKKEDKDVLNDELGTLPLTTSPLFSEFPKGLLMIRLKQIMLGLIEKKPE